MAFVTESRRMDASEAVLGFVMNSPPALMQRVTSTWRTAAKSSPSSIDEAASASSHPALMSASSCAQKAAGHVTDREEERGTGAKQEAERAGGGEVDLSGEFDIPKVEE